MARKAQARRAGDSPDLGIHLPGRIMSPAMPQTFSANHFHIIFRTKERRALIDDPPRMWQYLAGIANRIGCFPLTIGGVQDHVHLLIAVPPNISVASAVSKLKANSSKWMGSRFAWQRGYASFTVSASQISAVSEYIERQPEHHKRQDFREELLKLLRKHGVDFDERYVFD
jgi:putative transposase